MQLCPDHQMMKKMAFMKSRKLKDETCVSLLCLLDYDHGKWLSCPYDSVKMLLTMHNPILINAVFFSQLDKHSKTFNISFCIKILSNG